ncbi:MAG TPA: TRAP transporter substrate-binding protein DctP [Firmicutes bacterium]|jgi:TRAP-type C4-dicarboxylate transport system substrate-binding protein|nr:TRAP transporter substrate-binding protein DctP [Bacillota bacterium]
MQRKMLIPGVILLVLLLLCAIGCQPTEVVTPKEDNTGKNSKDSRDSIELRFTTVVSTLHPNFKSWEKYADEVFNRTDGKVKIVLYPTGTLNDPMDTYNAVKNGLADIGCAPVGYSASIMPLNKLYGDALMGIPNATEAAGIWTESFKNMPELQKELEDVHVLFLSSTAPLIIGTSKKEISKMEDLKGLVMRFPPGLEPLAKAWGASPVNMPIGDIYIGLEKGTMNGFFGGEEMLETMRLAELTEYVTDVSMVYGFNWTGMNLKVWESLPPDVQQVFNELSEWGQEITIEGFDESGYQSRQFALSQGTKFLEIEEDELQKIYNASIPVFEQITAELEGKGLPANKVLSEVEKINSQYLSQK